MDGNEHPRGVHVMAKPAGAVCNLSCEYCFYLEKEKLYSSSARAAPRMSDELLERYVRLYIEAQDVPQVHFAWQGGEPMLMGLDFYRKVVHLQEKHASGKRITNALQTNGVLLDDEWADFLSGEGFLVGISIDGPRELHDRYRADRRGKPTFDRVMAGLDALKKHRVEFNTLTVVHRHNADYPVEVYDFLTREAGSRFLQFIPTVERAANDLPAEMLQLVGPEFRGGASVAGFSVVPEQYGSFLTAVFDRWLRSDVGRYFVRIFDSTLAAWVGREPGICIFAETCGDSMIIEHDGEVYSCDHFVYPDCNLGNVARKSIREMARSPRQRRFGNDKRDRLPEQCRKCEFRFACNGGCPKLRFTKTVDGRRGLNYLCAGYKTFFGHAAPHMKAMADELLAGRPASNVMEMARRGRC